MNCVVVTEGRFVLKEGRPASLHNSYERFGSRYLHGFDLVTVAGRLYQKEISDASAVEGPQLSFFPLPAFIGLQQFLFRWFELQRALDELIAVRNPDVVILRVPGVLGSLVYRKIENTRCVVGLEVVGDPYDMFAPKSVSHPLRPVLRWWFTRELKDLCKNVWATSYVTESALQQRYPPALGRFTTHYSSVELPEEAFASSPRAFPASDRRNTLVTVTSLEQLQKGVDILLDAVCICVRGGLDLQLRIVGGGRYYQDFVAQANRLGISDRICFLGQLPAGEAVRNQLDLADIFVLPTRQEGLPRALIEAMARGVPSIATTVGGIPELLPPEDLFAPNDVSGLAQKIQEVLRDSDRMNRMAESNLKKARCYHKQFLTERREQFYMVLRTEAEKRIGALPEREQS